MKWILLIISTALMFSCGNNSTEKPAENTDTTKKLTDGAPAGNADTSKTVLLALPVPRAIAMINHYRDREVDPYRADARFANFNSDVLWTLFKNGPVNSRFCFAAYLADEPRADWRHRPTLIIQVTGPQKVEPQYYLAEDICPPPSNCGVPFK